MAIGGATVVLPVVAAFAAFGSFHWFWDANVGFFFSYIPSGEQIPLYYRPVILLPAVIAVAALVIHKHRGETPRWGLPALWFALMLAAAMLTGRPYGHYFLQTFPPLALLVVLIAPHLRLSWRPRRTDAPALAIAAGVALLWCSIVTPQFGDPFAFRNTHAAYYVNFGERALGTKGERDYNTYLDRRVNLTEAVATKLENLGAPGERVYIWGEYPWVYSLSGGIPATAYTTSFYVLLLPGLDVDLYETLSEADPRFIVMFNDAWPRWQDETGVMQRRYRNASQALNRLIAERYELAAVIGRATIFQRVPERPLVSEN